MSTLMEAKGNKSSEKKRKDPLVFIGELKEELKKVTWTTKRELISCTKIVLISTFCFGIGIYVVDLAIKGTIELVKYSILWFFG